jgi:hypothetical protein
VQISDEAELPSRRRVRLAAVGLVLITLSVLVGAAWGQRHPVVHVDESTCLALDTQIGCTLPDGWDIAVSTDVPWTGSRGVFHESGRPACLKGRGAIERVLLHWLKTSSGNRYVVEVACR